MKKQSTSQSDNHPGDSNAKMLDDLLRDTFHYFIDDTITRNGLIADKTRAGWPASIAVMGLGLTCYTAGIERGLITRNEGIQRTLDVLRFLQSSHQGPEPDASGYKGFYYHFLDMETGKRVWQCELSTVDTAILMAGVLTAMAYFTDDNKDEVEIRAIAKMLYERVDWQWALDGSDTLTHGWTPESGFLPHRWDNGYSEAHILYILALGSPTYPIPEQGYKAWIATFEWKRLYGQEFFYAGPLFIHQMSHLWIDFRGLYDDANRARGIDYFENSRRATYAQQQYAIENPLGFNRYGKYVWGLSASDGPGPAAYHVDGKERVFYDYVARGIPFGPDDGTISPWAVVASLPFAPEIVLDTIRLAIERLRLIRDNNHGFHASFNASFPGRNNHVHGWVSPWQFGLNQGPVVIMIENYQTGLVWKLLGASPYVATGLKRAGFTNNK